MSKYFLFLNKKGHDLNTSKLRAGITQILMILILACSLVWMSPTSVSALGITYYVNNTNLAACSDSTSGPQGTIDLPFCTLGRGALKAQAGDTVIVVAGTYAETIYPANNGTAGNPITFHANSGVQVTGQPPSPTTGYPAFSLSGKSYVVIDGFDINHTSGKGIYTDVSNHITISNNHISYAGVSSLNHPWEQGIYLKATTDSTIINNITDHNTCIGIRLLNGSNNNLVTKNISFANFSVVESDAAGIEMTGSSNNIISNNITYSNEDSGINLYVNSAGDPSSNNTVIGNLSYENGDHGIDNNGSPNNTIVGNTVHGNGTVGINFEGETGKGSGNATVMNNIIAANGFTPPEGSFGGNLRVDSASIAGTIIDYNLFNLESAATQIIWNNQNYSTLTAFRAAVAGQEVHGLEGNPLFVSPVASVLRNPSKLVPYIGTSTVGDYHILFGSPAIDSANSNAPSQLLIDIDGAPRVDNPGTPDTGAGVRTFDDRGAYEFQSSAPSLPIVTTQAVTAILATTATGNGNITAPGSPNPTQHGVVWGTAVNPTTANGKTTDGPVGAAGAFTSAITGLTPNTLYHVRAYATNPSGTVYGGDVSFRTSPIVATTTGVICGAGIPTLTYGTAISCVATVTAVGPPVSPVGTVTWSTSGAGSFVTSPCTLTVAGGISSCSVTYTPTSVGTGSHLITASFAANPNFLASSGNQAVTVNKKDASVTPNATSKTYGDGDPAFSGALVGFLPADVVNASYSRTVGETVGLSPYTITAVLSPAGVLPNYNITYNSASFTINKKIATVTPNADSKTYGDGDPAFSGALVGFLPADNIKATYTRTAGETAGGPYTISAALAPTAVLSNYTITYNTALFAINKRAITVKADSKTKLLGQVDPPLTYQLITGNLVNQDTFTGVLARESGDTAGVYAILKNTLALSNNYNLTYQGGTLTIYGIPVIPVTVSPVGTTTDARPTYTWQASPGAASYRLSVVNTKTAAFVINNIVVPASACTGAPSICTFRPAVNLGASTFRFGVAAVNPVGNSGFGPQTGWKTFTTQKPAIPVTVSPVGLITTVLPTYTWQASPGATSYLLSVVNTKTAAFVINSLVVPASACTGNPSICAWHPNVSLGGFTFRFGVAAVSSAGNSGFGLQTGWKTFTTQKPAIPVTVSPVDMITDARPLYTWQASQGATSYRLSVINTKTSVFVINSLVVPASACTGAPSICTFRPAVNLGAFTFRFGVAAVNSAGNSGFDPQTSWKTFTVQKPAAFVSVATQDGYVLESTETSGVGGSLNGASTVMMVGDNNLKYQYRSILSFNTASLPDTAVIVSATLKLSKQGVTGVDPFGTHGNLWVDISKPFLGASVVLGLDDFAAAAGVDNAGVVDKTPVSGRYVSILDASGLPQINKVGFTQLRLHFDMDDNNNAVADYLSFYSGNIATAAFRPVLEIVYYVP